MDVGGPLPLGEEVGYLVVLGVVISEGVLVVEGQVGGQEGDLVVDQGADLEEGQGAEDVAWDPSALQAYQEASRKEEHQVVAPVAAQRVAQGASLEELGEDPAVEDQSSVDLVNVEALAVQLVQQVVVDADQP